MTALRDFWPSDGYRPDIEGLRAVAVLAVLLFHLGLAGASGGFVGVDVFFVISGFLIGGIVLRAFRSGAFRWRDYLVRRVRRIVPVMLVVLAVTSIAAILVLLPDELAGFAESLGYSAVFLANIHFWLHRGAYAESEHEVLLHMWTLGVEGQFYLLLPVLVWGIARLGQRALWIGLVGIALGSAAISLLSGPAAGFYLLPARLWEFLAGTLVAITPLRFLRTRWLREIVAFTGLGLILLAVVTFDTGMPFPGWRAAIPCCGAAAIIAAGEHGTSLTGRVLTLAPVRFVGRISYSLYLWHWPVIVLLLLGLPAGELGTGLQVTAVVISFALATLSWRFVEEPCRNRGVPARPVMLGSGMVTAGLVSLGLVLAFIGGWPQRYSQRGREIAAMVDYPQDEMLRSGVCFIHHRSQSFDPVACLADDMPGSTRILLLGDIAHGAEDRTTKEVERITGRPANTLATFLEGQRALLSEPSG